MNDASPRFPAQSPGLFEATMHKLFARSVKVVGIADIDPAFRLVTLGGAALRNVTWTPGDKIQVQLGGWTQRTYTPIDWDGEAGRTRILVYLHAGGPGAHWARTLRPGAPAMLFGPRKSIALAAGDAPVVLLGDETSLGLAAALTHHGAAPIVHVVLEATAPAETAPALAMLGIGGAQVYGRQAGDGHVSTLTAALSGLLSRDARTDLVLTGKASTIQRVTRELKASGQSAGKRHARAYWADGKVGLD